MLRASWFSQGETLFLLSLVLRILSTELSVQLSLRILWLNDQLRLRLFVQGKIGGSDCMSFDQIGFAADGLEEADEAQFALVESSESSPVR